MSADDSLEQDFHRGEQLLQELAAVDPADNEDLPPDLTCLIYATKARAFRYYPELVKNPELMAALSMGLEAAFRLGARQRSEN